jgi:YD repeat-containing protein
VAGISDVRVTKMAYDANGRTTQVTDALDHSESFTYDGIGNKLTHTDKLGNTWTYGYDAAGRQVSETSPQVAVATSTVTGTVTTTTRAIVTLVSYDALGNVVSRTEDATGGAPRTIQYQYDNRGHQVRTIFPAAGRIDPATGQLVATSATDVVVTYDALGRAVAQKDTLGNYSYKVYNARGEVAYEVDQEGYVTKYLYNGFGLQISLTRYATRIVTTAMGGWTAGSPITLAQIQGAGVVPTSSADRSLTTTWDQRGNKLSVAQGSIYFLTAAGASVSGSPKTTFTYDGFGQLVKESVLLDASTGASADTWHYYDAMGRQLATVDAEGYLTAWQYDARGQVVAKMEFAEKIYTGDLTAAEMPVSTSIGNATIGYNRGFAYTYDALGRKTSETATLHVQATNGTTSASQTTTGYAYDAEDHLTVTTVGGVANSTVAYDALGHATSVTEASRQALAANWQALLAASSTNTLASAGLYTTVAPVTSMQYDAFGNAVKVTRSGAGATSQVTTTAYDAQGRALVTRDAEGTVWYSAYDAADHLVDSWYTLSINGGSVTVHATASYDMIGRQVATATTRTLAGGTVVTDASSAVRYDAFGGITSKAATAASLGSSTAAANYTYDRAGNLLTSNAATGKTYTYQYDLAGHELREARPWTDGTTAATAYYTNTVDKLGRVIAQRIPSWNTDAAATATIGYTLDRWGNVLRQVDPRGNTTEYAYNERNQVTRRTDPQVLVVDEDGTRHTEAPVSQWMYDALGRLIASRDANGHARTFEYDAAGELVRSVDATGAATRQGYDAFGRNVAAQDARGHITFSNYNGLDRVVAQGDFTLDAAGTARIQTTLQAYLLNQNGDRTRVTDGTGRWTQYDYDSRSLLVRSQTQAGVVHTYTYDAQGRKTKDLDGLGKSNTWTYDFYGKLTDHHDLGGADYNYVYDARSGLLTNSSSTLTETFTPPPGGRDPWDF